MLKPVVVHTRSAKHDTVDIIRAEQSTHGILHCFTEDWKQQKLYWTAVTIFPFQELFHLKCSRSTRCSQASSFRSAFD